MPRIAPRHNPSLKTRRGQRSARRNSHDCCQPPANPVQSLDNAMHTATACMYGCTPKAGTERPFGHQQTIWLYSWTRHREALRTPADNLAVLLDPAPRGPSDTSRGPLGAGSKSTAKLSAGVRRASRCRVQEYSQIVCWCPNWPLGAGSKSTAKLSAGVRTFGCTLGTRHSEALRTPADNLAVLWSRHESPFGHQQTIQFPQQQAEHRGLFLSGRPSRRRVLGGSILTGSCMQYSIAIFRTINAKVSFLAPVLQSSEHL